MFPAVLFSPLQPVGPHRQASCWNFLALYGISFRIHFRTHSSSSHHFLSKTMGPSRNDLAFALATICSMPNLCEKNVTASLPFPDFYFYSPFRHFSSALTPAAIFLGGNPGKPPRSGSRFFPRPHAGGCHFPGPLRPLFPLVTPGSVTRTVRDVSCKEITASFPNVSRRARNSSELFFGVQFAHTAQVLFQIPL